MMPRSPNWDLDLRLKLDKSEKNWETSRKKLGKVKKVRKNWEEKKGNSL